MPLPDGKRAGKDGPGVPTINQQPSIGDLILERYDDTATDGRGDLKRFELIDQFLLTLLKTKC
jgi:hypothetical protein